MQPRRHWPETLIVLEYPGTFIEPRHVSDNLTLSNPRIQRLRRLVSRRQDRRSEGVLVIEGPVLIRDAVEAGWTFESQFVGPQGTPVAGAGEVHRLADGVIEKIASTRSPRPIVAIAHVPTRSRDLLEHCDFIVIADGVSDPGNLGTIIRSAEAAGAGAVVATQECADFTNPKVVRSSAGSVFRVPVLEVDSIEELEALELTRLGTSSHDDVARHAPLQIYTDVDFTRPIAIVLGNEPRGLSAESAIEEWVTIPLAGGAESLNVAMAGAVLCFEVARQRRKASDTVDMS